MMAKGRQKNSVADPGCLSHKYDPGCHPGSWIQGSNRHRIPDPDPVFFTHPGSRGRKGTGSRIRNTVKYRSVCMIAKGRQKSNKKRTVSPHLKV
jgi:hypothetical protein